MRVFVLGNYMNANFLFVDRLPVAGESLAATGHFQEHGGKGLNLAVGLHRLGVAVDLLMAVGQDEAGEAVTRRLTEEGIDTERVLALGPSSGYGVGFITAGGGNFLAAYLGANALLNREHVEQNHHLIARADWVVAQFEIPDSVILHAFRWARHYGKSTYLNPSPWRGMDDELLALTDVLVVNATEARLMFNQSDRDTLTRDEWLESLPTLSKEMGWKGKLLVVTLAEAGCVAIDETGEVLIQPAYPVHQVDATGAGDAFGAGLVWSLLRGLPVSEALRIANVCGALVAARQGIFDGLPRQIELAALMTAAIPG
ncbi:MAG: ribokinase [Gammaproteobacteria bacterium]|nr:ribokinase [Gammaproteobacteria bacterium]